MQTVQRLPAEQQFQTELEALMAAEKDPVPTGWRMSPRSVLTYICGGKAGGMEITPKYVGNRRLVEICIATLVTDLSLIHISFRRKGHGDPKSRHGVLGHHKNTLDAAQWSQTGSPFARPL